MDSSREEEFEKLVEHHYQPVYRFLLRVSGDREVAFDLTQETFLRLYRAAGSLRAPEKARTWIFTVALNVFRDHRRRCARRPELLAAEPVAAGESPEEAVVQAMDLEVAIARLGADHATALVLRFYEGMSLEQVARVTGVPVGTVKSRLHHAIKLLRREILRGEVNRLGCAGT